MQISSDKGEKKRTCLTNDFYKAYVSHNQDFLHDHTVGIKFRE